MGSWESISCSLSLNGWDGQLSTPVQSVHILRFCRLNISSTYWRHFPLRAAALAEAAANLDRVITRGILGAAQARCSGLCGFHTFTYFQSSKLLFCPLRATVQLGVRDHSGNAVGATANHCLYFSISVPKSFLL
jgi:hypothetical protein